MQCISVIFLPLLSVQLCLRGADYGSGSQGHLEIMLCEGVGVREERQMDIVLECERS